MKDTLIFISEHNNHTIGGTVTFQKQLLYNISKYVKQIIFIYPSTTSEHYLNKDKIECYGIEIRNFIQGKDNLFKREQRLLFVNRTNALLKNLCIHENTIVHILFGWYLFDKIDYDYIHNNGAKISVTIHNIPPQECGTTWYGDNLLNFLKGNIKNYLLRLITFKRFYKNGCDCIFVPSLPVSNQTIKIIKWVNKSTIVRTIQHGVNTTFKARKGSNKLILLTVGGITPSKRQLIIPKIANNLSNLNIDFKWNIVGPIRNQNYYDALVKSIQDYRQSNNVIIHSYLPESDLYRIYSNSSIYIHTGKEEGFCFTGIDAVLNYLPIIAIQDTGELPILINKSYGKIVDGSVLSFTNAITELLNTQRNLNKINENEFLKFYSWDEVAKSYLYEFNQL